MFDNFWMWIINGIITIAQTVIFPLLPAADAQNAINFATSIGNGTYLFFELVFAFFGIFNMNIMAACWGIALVCWFIQGAVSIYLFISRLWKAIPIIGR